MNVIRRCIKFTFLSPILILTGLMLISCSATWDRCALEFDDGGKVDVKNCKDKGKKISDSYAIYENKVWYVSPRSLETLNERRRFNSCPNPSCVGSFDIDLNPLREIKEEIWRYTRLPLDANKIRTSGNGNYITDGTMVYYFDKKIDIADPATFQVYETTDPKMDYSFLDLAWDSKALYISRKKNDIPVSGAIKVINSELIVSGDAVYALQEDNRSFKKLDNISATLRGLPGRGLSTDGKYLLSGSKIIDTLDRRGVIIVKAECPVEGYPLLECTQNKDVHVIRVKNTVWVQFNNERYYEPRKVQVDANDRIHYFNLKNNSDSYPYLIVNDKKLYNIDPRDFGLFSLMTTFSGFLANINFNGQYFLEEKGRFTFEGNDFSEAYKVNERVGILNKSPDSLYRLKSDTKPTGKLAADGSWKPDPYIIVDDHHEYQIGE